MYPVTVADTEGSEEDDASPLAYSKFYPWKTPQQCKSGNFWKIFYCTVCQTATTDFFDLKCTKSVYLPGSARPEEKAYRLPPTGFRRLHCWIQGGCFTTRKDRKRLSEKKTKAEERGGINTATDSWIRRWPVIHCRHCLSCVWTYRDCTRKLLCHPVTYFEVT